MRHSYVLVQFLLAMENSESESSAVPSRKPPVALVLINRPEDGPRILSLEPEDLRLLKQVLNWAGYQSFIVDIDDDVDRINDAVVLYKPTVIINLVEQMFGDVWQAPAVAAMLDLFGYVYTGSEPSVLLDCLDWAKVQVLLEHAGLPLCNGRGTRRLHACLLGNDEVELLPIGESVVLEGQPVIAQDTTTSIVRARIEHLAWQVWDVLGLRDIAQIDFDVSLAGRVSITGVTAAVDIFGTVFRTAAAGREGGMPGTLVRLSRLCHERLSAEELLAYPLP